MFKRLKRNFKRLNEGQQNASNGILIGSILLLILSSISFVNGMFSIGAVVGILASDYAILNEMDKDDN